MIKKVQDLGLKLTEIGRNLRIEEEYELVGQRVSKSGKNDNDRSIYRLPKEERAGRSARHPDRTTCSIGQSVRSAGLFDRLRA